MDKNKDQEIDYESTFEAQYERLKRLFYPEKYKEEEEKW